MLLETHQGSEDSCKHTSNREHSNDCLEVFVYEPMHSDTHRPSTLEPVNLSCDGKVAPPEAQVACEALEENEQLMVTK